MRDLGVVFGSNETSGAVFSCVVEFFDVESCLVQLLVLKAGPSVQVTVSMLMIAGVAGNCSINLERKSAALFLAPEIHSNIML